MGFFDLNIPYLESDRHPADKSQLNLRRLKLTLKAMELGYTGIAFNRTLKGVMSESSRCSTPLYTLSKLGPSSSSSFTSAVEFHRELLKVAVSSPFRQYTRLTVVVDSPAQASALNSGNPVLRSYDVVAVRPMNQNAFDQACQTSEVDIIAIDFTDKLPFRLKQPMVKAAIKRGVYFEITYSGLIVDQQSRRQMISNCKLLVDWTRGKNLIFSSAATSPTELRGPLDVANLVSLLGLPMESAKAAISKNCRSILTKALRKKHFYKEAVRVEEIPAGKGSNPEKSAFDDFLEWDPISSGDGDMLLDDMRKSFSMLNNKTKAVKTIDFTSTMNSLPAHGLQIKDIISVTKRVTESPDVGDCLSADMETEETATVVENPDGHNSLPEDQGGLPVNQGILDALTKEDGAILLSKGQTYAQDVEESLIFQIPGPLDFVSKDLIAVKPNPEAGHQISTNVKNGHQASGTEILPVLPACSDVSTNLEKPVALSSRKSNSWNEACEMQLQNTQLRKCGSKDMPDDGRVIVTSDKEEGALNSADQTSAKLCKPLNVSVFTDLQLEDLSAENGCVGMSAEEHPVVDKFHSKIDPGNERPRSLVSSDSTSEDILMQEELQYRGTINSSDTSNGGLCTQVSHGKIDFKLALLEDVTAECRQKNFLTSDQGSDRSLEGSRKEKRKQSSSHQHLLPPFKRFLNSGPVKRRRRSKNR